MNLKFRVTTFLIFSVLIIILVIQACKSNSGQKNEEQADIIWKENLSDFHFFASNLKEMIPEEDVYPYNIVTPLFSDYAIKDRFIRLPKNSKIGYTAEGVLDFPVGTYIIKFFSYKNEQGKQIMIETRMMYKEPSGNWDVMNYLWNNEQTDAQKYLTGSKIPLTLKDNQGNNISTVYQVPNVNDCKRCHISNKKLIPIGPKARNLNYTVHGQSQNQLTNWAAKGILTGLPDVNTIERLPDWQDGKKYSLEERARAYLDINCSYCHTKGGDAYNTGLFLEYDQHDPNHIGIMKIPVSAGGGAGGLNYDIVPGNADSSILHYRMNSTEPGTAMPELNRTIIHKEGVALIREWINRMKK